MKSTKTILLIIGTIGLIAAAYGFYRGGSVIDQLLTLVCGASLLVAGWRMGPADRTEADKKTKT